ncbi:hypothetical protein BO221_11715 [Archangium sp. Cb G35]|uniref:hypothetical protein n=1 Tax=Archangium sp. Cb G35 TaxID=1920190 RepID=UPI000935DFDB|nr:hypothetical protein [Archangium sp. Cb G35]OJT25043.1 hypothetical protein BO221_11715 [Archangium sp. Cb G35]
MDAQVKWVLSIDESGDFDTPNEHVCVGGLLLQEADSFRLAQVLRAKLEEVYPHLPYPPHATELHRLSCHLVGWRSLSPARRAEVPREFEEPLTRAEQRVLAEAGLPPELAVVPGQAPPRPKLPALVRCDTWLRMRAEASDALQAVRWTAQGRMKRLLEELSRLYSGGCLTVAAAESMGAVPGPFTDRYLNLLVALFQRTIALLRSFQKPVYLSIRTATRHVLRPTGGRTSLTRADVHQAFNEALRISGIGTPIHTVVVPPEDYSSVSVHPGLVLADHLMNQLRVQLTPRSWEVLAQGFWKSTGVAVELPDPLSGQPLPTVSANGAPRAFLEAAFTGQPLPGLSGVQPAWAVDEARLWLSALEARKRTGGET